MNNSITTIPKNAWHNVKLGGVTHLAFIYNSVWYAMINGELWKILPDEILHATPMIFTVLVNLEKVKNENYAH